MPTRHRYLVLPLLLLLTFIGRICRANQKRKPHAKIFGNPAWVGDAMAFHMKNSRGEGQEELQRALTAGEWALLDF